MARLPTTSRNLVLTDAARSTVSASEIATPYRIIGQALGSIGEDMEEVAIDRAADAGANAVYIDPETGAPQMRRRQDWTRAGRAYNAAATQAYMARLSTDMRARGAALAREANGNVEVFEREWAKYARTILAGAGPEVRGAVELALEQSRVPLSEGIIETQRRRDVSTFEGQIRAEMALLDDEMAALARVGGTNTPDYLRRQQELTDLMGALVANPDFTLGPREAEIELQRLSSRHLGEALVGQVQSAYRTGGMAAAQAAAEQILSDPDLALTPAERRSFHSRALGSLDTLVAERAATAREIGAVAATIIDRLGEGVGLDDPDVDRVAGQLAAAGDVEGAIELVTARAVAQQLDTFGRMDSEAQAQALASQFDPAAGFEQALIGRESSGNPAVVNRLGYAGLYQFGAPRLVDSGVYTPSADEAANMRVWSQTPRDMSWKWTGTFNIPGFPDVRTLDDFLASPGAQRAAFMAHVAKMDEEIEWLGLGQFIGQTVGGVTITRGGLYAMMHLGGAGGAQRVLESGGSINPADENGTTLLDYAALGRPYADAEVLRAMRTEVASDTREMVGSIIAGLDAGLPPSRDELDILSRNLQLVGDADLNAEIADHLVNFENGYLLSTLPAAEREMFIAELTAEAAEDGVSVAEQQMLASMQRVHERTARQLAEDPLALGIATQTVSAPAPLDFSGPADVLGAALTERQGAIHRIEARYSTTGLSVLRPAEQEALAERWESATANERLSLVAAFGASLDEATLQATMDSIADGSGRMMANVAMLYRGNPQVAASVLRGEMLLAENPNLGPRTTEGGWSVDAVVDPMLAPGVFHPLLEGARQDMLTLARLRYADLSAIARDVSGVLDEGRMEQAVNEVTGGVLRWNSADVIAPVYGMSQRDFETLLWSVPDSAYASVRTMDGRGVTAQQVRDQGRLRGVGDGRYYIEVGSGSAIGYLLDEEGRPFVLDLGALAGAR